MPTKQPEQVAPKQKSEWLSPPHIFAYICLALIIIATIYIMLHAPKPDNSAVEANKALIEQIKKMNEADHIRDSLLKKDLSENDNKRTIQVDNIQKHKNEKIIQHHSPSFNDDSIRGAFSKD